MFQNLPIGKLFCLLIILSSYVVNQNISFKYSCRRDKHGYCDMILALSHCTQYTDNNPDESKSNNTTDITHSNTHNNRTGIGGDRISRFVHLYSLTLVKCLDTLLSS